MKEEPPLGAKLASRLATTLARILPRRWGQALAQGLGRLTGRLSSQQRAILESNLVPVLEDPDPRYRRKVAIEIFGHAIQAYYDLIAAYFAQPEEILSWVNIDEASWTQFQQTYHEGKGLILVVAHQSSFDLAARFLITHELPVSVLVLPESGFIYSFLNEFRVAGGIRTLAAGPRAVRQALRVLRRGEILVVTGDRPVKGQGTMVEFFGRPTVLPDGHVRLALHTGAPLGVAYNRREEGQFRTSFQTLEISRYGDEERDIRENVQQIARALERNIRAHPEQWHLFLQLWE